MPLNGKFINWDNGGGFGPDDWRIVHQLVLQFNVTSVIEYGCGLSTELFMAIGMPIISIETVAKYADIPGADIVLRPYGQYPEDLGHFDMAFIDGPGAYEFESTGRTPDRKLSAEHAKRHADLVYMHDGGLGQPEVFENDSQWMKIRENVWRRV